MNNYIWDKLFKKYEQSVKKDENADFAYESLVNTLSILSLCDNLGVALDLGCGDGRFTKELEVRCQKTFAVDLSDSMLKQAKKVCLNTTFLKVDLENKFPKFNTKFDLITCKLVLMYLTNIENLACETYKILNKNGALVVSVTHPMKWMDKTSYLKEDVVPGEIANDKNLKVTFKSRTIQTYINTFTKYGFHLEMVLETGVPDSFVIKYPDYLAFQKKPYRLNLKFVKK